MWAKGLLIKHELSHSNLKESDPSSAGQNILDSSWQAENKILHSGSDKRLRRANCGFISSVWAELQLARPSTEAQTAVFNTAR